MGKEVASLYATLGIDTSKFNDGMHKAKSQISSMGGPLGGLSSAFKGLGGSMLGALGVATTSAAAIAGLVNVTRESISAASDLSETTNKVSVVFGSAAGSILKFGKTSAAALGMSENAALAAAGTYGNLFRAMGISVEKSSEMSKSLVQLAADLASFNNMDPGLVLDKLRAGLSGEVEPLRSLGVNLNEVIIKQKALAIGVWDGEGAITASAKAMASYQLILEQTSLAQGDFARTSEGLANQMRILDAQKENLKASWGELTLPVALKFVGWTNTMVEAELASQNFGKQMKELGYTFLFSGLYIKDWKIVTADAGKEMLATIEKAGKYVNRFDKMSDSVENFGNKSETAATNTAKLYTSLSLLSNIDTNYGSNIASALDKIKFKEAGGGALQGLGESVLGSIDAGTLGLEIGSEMATSIAIGLEAVKVQTGEESAYEARRVIVDTLGLTWVEANTQLNAWLKDPKSMTIDVNFRYNTLMNNSSNGIPISPQGWEVYFNQDLNKNGIIGKATGGPVWANHDYMVGEKGVEMFRPTQNGTIIPNNKLGAAGQTVNFYGDTYFDVADKNIADDILKQARLAV